MTPAAPTAAPALRLLLADDHELVRVAMRSALAPLAPTIDWREAADAAAAEAELERTPAVDLALLDLHMPDGGFSTWIASVRGRHPAIPLVVLSADEDPGLVRSLIDHGVSAFIPTSDSAAIVLQAVRLVLSGGTYAPLRLVMRARDDAGPPGSVSDACAVATLPLTPRQADVLLLLARGLPNKQIARELGVSEATVKVHMLAIFRALGVNNRTQALVAAQRRLRVDGRTAARPGAPGSH
jgi:DNA-binding NarL/FixJ family response regulator